MNFRIKIINRDYSILLIGQLVSLLGNIINGVAMMWIVYEVLGSAGKTGLLFGLSVIPSIALTPFAGNLADMMNRKYLLFICDLLAGVNSLVLFFLAKNNMLNFTNVFIILSIGSVLFSMLSSVRSSMIQNLVKANDYLKANSVITLMRNLGSIMLPTVGAFLIAKYDASFCFLIDGLSFIIASIITLNIKSYIYKKIDNITFLDNFKAGIIYLKKNLHYINFIILFSLINFLIASDIMLVRILLDKKNFGVKFLGFFETCMAIGSILMTLIISQVKTKEFSTYKEKTFMNRALALEAFAYLLFGFFGDGYLLLFGAAMLGAGSTWMNVSFFSYMQKTVEKEYYGRVISLIFFVSQIMRPLSFSVFGALTERVPILTMFFGVSGGLFIITIVFKKCFNPKEKKLSRVT